MHIMMDYLIHDKKIGLKRSCILKVINFIIFRDIFRDIFRIFLNCMNFHEFILNLFELKMIKKL